MLNNIFIKIYKRFFSSAAPEVAGYRNSGGLQSTRIPAGVTGSGGPPPFRCESRVKRSFDPARHQGLCPDIAKLYRSRLNYHLILTDTCNLCCSYCRGKAFEATESDECVLEIDEDLPVDFEVEPELLYRFLKRDPDAVLTFYGGEPLLRPDLIREIVAHAPAKAFQLHTNGQLLHQLDPELVNRLTTILVSIDGPEELNDKNRGKGTFRTIMRNLNRIVDEGYSGEIIARMTVTEDTDLYSAVRYLAENDAFPFRSVHWQLDANFWHDYHTRKVEPWLIGQYNPGIRRLVDEWVDRMRKTGTVSKWYPFLDTMQDMLLGRASLLRCGCGHANYSILTDGHIVPCPCMVGMKEYYLGHIRTADPLNLRFVPVGGSCSDCTILDFCGGRCLYSAITHPWPEEGREMVCRTVRNLHDVICAALPEVRDLIRQGRICIQDFEHARYNSCEIIP